MTSGRSFRSQLLAGSLLWTIGVMVVMSVLLIVFLATHPQPHLALLSWFLSVPLALSLAVGLGCLGIGARVIWRGLQAMDLVRADLADVHVGATTRLTGTYPLEVQPLVTDLNALLTARDERMTRAAARAADMAHGLKTPLAVLARDADLVASHDPALATSLAAQVARMARQIDHHLSQARVAAAGSATGMRAPLGPAVDGLFRALERLHADRRLAFAHDVPADHVVRCAPEDLDEMLGNLLDNACTWCRGCVRVSSARVDTHIVVTVDDDGEGVAPLLMPLVLQRGARADERVPGSGLGLAIVHDLAEVYEGSVALERSPMGGLRVRLALPAASADARAHR